jgi:hypothetical protein
MSETEDKSRRRTWITGRIVWKNQQNYTVTGESSLGEIHVWDPVKHELLIFDSLATFENWAYEKPVASGACNGERD